MAAQQLPNLLTLPPEIRNQIWRSVLGDRIIQISVCTIRKPSNEYSHHSVLHSYIDGITDLSPISTKDITLQVKPFNQSRQYCIQGNCQKPHSPFQKCFTGLLFTNRQISSEARFILYATNLFSFLYVSDMMRFFHTTTAIQRSHINAIRIEGTIVNSSLYKEYYGPMLPALKTVYFHVDFRSNGPISPLPQLTCQAIHSLYGMKTFMERMGLEPKELPISLEIWVSSDMSEDERLTLELSETSRRVLGELREEILQGAVVQSLKWWQRKHVEGLAGKI